MFPEQLQTVRLTIVDDGQDGDNHTREKRVYSLKVVDVKRDRFTIQSPIERHLLYKPLHKGTMVEISFVHNESLYAFQTEVLDQYQDNEPLLVLRKPSADQIRKIQRREYLRVPVHLHTRVTLGDGRKTDVPLRDLSGGGLSIVLPEAEQQRWGLGEGSRVKGNIQIEEKEKVYDIPYTAQVVYVKHDEEKARTAIALMFTEIKESDREVIVRYCFNRQLELRKKQV
jgi:c-di-GMP-binding flagellar brake protein YcgR